MARKGNLISVRLDLNRSSDSSRFSMSSSNIKKYFFSFLILFALLAVVYYISFILGSMDACETLVWRLACSASKEALSRLLLRGSCVTLIMAVGFALRAFFLATEGGLSMADYMMPHGAAESDLFTYTSDLEDDSASSGRSGSTPSVNQPLPGEQAMPPALPVMQEAANPVGEQAGPVNPPVLEGIPVPEEDTWRALASPLYMASVIHIPGEIDDPLTLHRLSKLNGLLMYLSSDVFQEIRPEYTRAIQLELDQTDAVSLPAKLEEIRRRELARFHIPIP